jgi:hypothetical protein
MKTNQRDHMKIELTPTQQDPGAAKPEDFEVQQEIPGDGQNGDTRAERDRIMRERAAKRRKPYIPTPDRHTPNDPGKPKTGSRLGK